MRPQQLAAVAQVVLEGVPLPAEKQELLDYAERQSAPPEVRAALAALPKRSYEYLDEVGEEIAAAQPSFSPPRVQRPSAESGAPPGGAAYVDASAEPGSIRDEPEVLPYEEQLVREPAPVGEGIPSAGERDLAPR
jgi:hypothetical protein